MEFEVPRLWFRLSLSERPGRVLLVDAEDEAGRRWTSPPTAPLSPPAPLFVPGADEPFSLVLPTQLAPAMTAAAERLPRYRTGARLTPPPLPLFIHPPEGLAHLGWEAVSPVELGLTPAVPIVLVVQSGPQGRRSGPSRAIKLPLRLLLVGDVGLRALDGLRADSSWFRPQPGLVEPVWSSSVDAVTALSRDPFDAVVLEGWDALTLAMRSPTQRFAVVVDQDALPGARPVPAPAGLARSVLGINVPDAADLVVRLFETLAHDLPLHHALAELVAHDPALVARLDSTPDAVHDLRIMDLFVDAARARHEIESSIRLADLPDDAGAALAEAAAVTVDFAFESRGLHPLGRAQERLADTRRAIADLPQARGEQPGTRVVDLAVRRGADVLAAEREAYVSRHCGIQANARYHLEIRIGLRGPSSVVTGEEPIDPLLPDSRHGHDLEVVVHRGNFGLAGRARRPMHLPPTGPSEILTFDLTAPAGPGPASLRVSILHVGNVIQTYLLTARVDEEERLHPAVVTNAVLDYTATAAWTNVPGFGPRHLSLVVNAAGDGTHRLYATATNGRTGGAVAEYAMSNRLDAAVLGPLRRALASAATSTDAAGGIRSVAALGRDAWMEVFNSQRPGPLRDLLREVVAGSDRTVQINRADLDRSIPWTLLYDWRLPPTGTASEVCWGHDGGGPCAHRWDDGVVCVRGFWGVRHQLEERIGPNPVDLPDRIARRAGGLCVDIAVGLDPVGPHITNLIEELQPFAPATRIDRNSSLLGRLWDVRARAPVVAVVGHNDASIQALDCGTLEKQLTPEVITQYAVTAGDWTERPPMLLLLACESGSQSPESVTGHVKALNATGAGAVVATECVVYTPQVRGFTRTLIAELARPHARLGAAMQLARQQQLAEQQVAALGFVAFGSADLEVE